jgi:hypothetical protein
MPYLKMHSLKYQSLKAAHTQAFPGIFTGENNTEFVVAEFYLKM